MQLLEADHSMHVAAYIHQQILLFDKLKAKEAEELAGETENKNTRLNKTKPITQGHIYLGAAQLLRSIQQVLESNEHALSYQNFYQDLVKFLPDEIDGHEVKRHIHLSTNVSKYMLYRAL